MLAAVGAGPALAVVADMDVAFFARHSREGGVFSSGMAAHPVTSAFGLRSACLARVSGKNGKPVSFELSNETRPLQT
jgi:hypothetical protein